MGVPTKRLLLVAEDSLIVEAIAIALRSSGEFRLLGRIDGRTATVHAIVELLPDVVMVDDLEDSERLLALVRELKQELPDVVVLVLTLSRASGWLDAIFAAGAAAALSKDTQPAALTTPPPRDDQRARVAIGTHRRDQMRRRPDGRSGHIGSSPRESWRCYALVAAGSTNSEIARKLWVTEQTVKFHLSNVYRKLDVSNRTEASRYAHVTGLVGNGGSQL